MIELRLRTRIPMSRLIDLFDQSILYLHLGDAPEQLKKDRQILREYGIRTATDLLLAEAASEGKSEQLAGLLSLLVPGKSRPPTPEQVATSPNCLVPAVPRLRTIIDTLKDDEWLAYLQNWRKLTSSTQTVDLPDKFCLG